MNIHWLMRMKRWVQHPPSPKRIKIIAAVIAACALIFALEWASLLPDWMQADRYRGVRDLG